MKKIGKLIIFLFMFLPLIINARVDYDSAVNYANNYISRFEKYSDYIYLENRIPFVFLNGESVYNSKFTNGGLLSAEEYAITNFGSNTYLANGLEYWTLTQADYNRNFVINYKLERAFLTDKSGVRVTEFIKDDVSVTGTGSYGNSWVFDDMLSVYLNSDNTIRGKVSTVECSDNSKKKANINVNVADGKEKTFYICPENGYKYYKSPCSKYIVSDGGNKYHLKDVDKDNLICNLSFTYSTNKVTLTRCSSCTTDSSPSTIYVNKVHNLWFSDSNGLSPITKITRVPVRTGYTFDGYKNGSTLIIKPNGTFASSNISSNVSLTPAFTANTYNVALSATDATSSNHTTSFVATYDADLPVITFPERSYNVSFNPNGGSVANSSLTSTYTFVGYYYGSTKYYNGGVSTWNIARDETLIAKWSGGAITTPVPVRQGYIFNGWYDAAGNKVVDGGVSYFPTKNISLIAKWTAGTSAYTVKHYQQNLNDDDYTLVSTQNLSGTTDTSITPARNSYTGFTAPVGQTVNIDPDGGRVVSYYYTRNKYSVTLSKGTGVSTVSGAGTFKYGASVTVNSSLKAGYSFLSWSGTLSSSNQSYTFTLPASNVTLTANGKGHEVAYKVRHYQRNVNSTESTLVQTETLSAVTDTSVTPARKSYTGFDSPAAQSAVIKGDGSTIIDYYYTRKSYTVTVNKGTGIASVSGGGTYQYGASVSVNATVSTGYIWSKWSNGNTSRSHSFTMSADNLSLTATATPISYTIQYNCNGGSGSTTTSNHVYDTAKALTANGCSKTSYKFVGWDYNGTTYSNQQSVKNLTSTNNAVLTFDAIWTLDVADYTVKHYKEDEAGGTYTLNESNKFTDTIGKSVTPSTKTYTGFVSPSTKSINITADGNASVSYNYNRYRHSIQYDCNGGSGSTATSTHLYDASKALTANGCSKTGFHFSSWNTKADGSGTSYTNKQIVKNLTTTNNAVIKLYAQWTRNKYTVTYNCNGGSGSTASSEHTYGVESKLSVNGCSYGGRSYGGWNTKSDGSGTNYSNQQAVSTLTSTNNGTVTLYAKWTPCAAGTSSSGLSCTQCQAGTYSGSAASSCTACPSGYTSSAGTTSISNCYISVSAGKYIASANSSTQSSCGTGTYKAAHTVKYGSTSSCTACPSPYVNGAGATAQSGCKWTVPAGKYVASANATSASSCATGTYKASHTVSYGGTSSCGACPSGYTAGAGATSQSGCQISVSAGKYIASANATGQTACPTGTYKAAHKVNYGSTSSCSSCPSGYTAGAGATAQSGCQISVSAGKYIGTANSTTQTSCGTGTYKTAHTVNYGSTSSCSACPSGYTAGAGATSQSGCRISVSAGKYIASANTTTQTSCAAGYYKASHTVAYGSTSSCSSCAAGKYSSSGASSCSSCPAGYYCPGGTDKKACAAGTYSTGSATICSTCSVGYYCPGSSNQIGCPAGKYSGSGASSCSTCTAGYRCPGSSNRIACAAGTYSSSGASSCSTCTAGYRCPGSSDRIACSAGTYSSSGASSCSTCTAGYRCPGSSNRIACTAGTYSSSGASSCTSCPSDQTSGSAASSCYAKPTYTATASKSNFKEGNAAINGAYVGWVNEWNSNVGYSGGYYAHVQKFVAPSFSGTSKNINFSMWVVRNSGCSGASSVTVRYAIASSEANKTKYISTSGAVSDSYQLASGTVTISGLAPAGGTTYLDVNLPVTGLASGGTYYAYFWPASTSACLITFQTGYHNNMTVTYY